MQTPILNSSTIKYSYPLTIKCTVKQTEKALMN